MSARYLLSRSGRLHTLPSAGCTPLQMRCICGSLSLHQGQPEGQGHPGLRGTTGRVQRDKYRSAPTPHWFELLQQPWKTKDELLNVLVQSKLYEDEHLIAINKPNGLPMHAAMYSEQSTRDVPVPDGEELSVMSVAAELQRIWNVPKLTEVYAQNRLHSGVTVFAKTEDAVKKLGSYFIHARTNRVLCQHFWALGVGQLEKVEGHQRFPITRVSYGKYSLSEKAQQESQHQRRRHLMIVPEVSYTELNVLKASQWKVSLVELRPTQTKWDFMQLLMLHLKTPILGDHKYSSRLKLILDKPVLVKGTEALPQPQVLPFGLTKKLGLSQSETGQIPLHLHCSQLHLPAIRGKKMATRLTIDAPLPQYFERTLHCLQQTGDG